MRLMKQYWTWENNPGNQQSLKRIERAARTCYKSENKIADGSAEKMVRFLVQNGHHSVLEHVSASVRFITSRSVTHELVRHRIAAYSQESQRYVKYGDNMQFIRPVWSDLKCRYYDCIEWPEAELESGLKPELSDYLFLKACLQAQDNYNALINAGWRSEQAREVLPNAIKTEIVVTYNLREWRHVFCIRTSVKAHPQMRKLMKECLNGFKKELPIFFEDIA